MKELFFILLLLITSGFSDTAFGQNASLPSEARSVLTKNFPQWNIVENACQTAITGDYNKDNQSDYIAVISYASGGSVVGLISQGKDYKPFIIQSMSDADAKSQTLSALRKGERVLLDNAGKTGQPAVRIKSDGFYLGGCGSGSGTSYIFINNEFVKMDEENASSPSLGKSIMNSIRGKKKSKPQAKETKPAVETAKTAPPPAKETTGNAASKPQMAATKSTDKINVKLYLFEIGKGKVGCGDKLIEITASVTKQPSMLRAALDELFRYPEQSGQANSTLGMKLSDVKLVNGLASIYVRGSLGGECDDPRFIAQITSTAKQFPTVKNVKIYLNGREFTGSMK